MGGYYPDYDIRKKDRTKVIEKWMEFGPPCHLVQGQQRRVSRCRRRGLLSMWSVRTQVVAVVVIGSGLDRGQTGRSPDSSGDGLAEDQFSGFGQPGVGEDM